MRMLGIPMDFIYGFEGYGEVAIAVERGEIEESNRGCLGTYRPGYPWLKARWSTHSSRLASSMPRGGPT